MISLPIDLSKVKGVKEKIVVKRTEYEKLVKRFNAFQTTDTSDLVKKVDYDTKLGRTGNKLLIIIIVIMVIST